MQSKQSLEFDKRCLSDLGLKMPRCTQKYLSAIAFLSRLYQTSAYFFHIAAARNGTDWLYAGLQTHKIRYNGGDWHDNSGPTPVGVDAAISSHGVEQEQSAAQLNFGR